jgi:hypothetical protein
MVEADDPATLTDAELLSAFCESSGEPGDPISDALAAEIERRGLDV